MTGAMASPMTGAMAYTNGVPHGQGHALPHMADPMAIRCYGTGRYGTERKSHQDPDENSSVSYAAGPVDKSESLDSETVIAARRTLSDEWFDDFIARCSERTKVLRWRAVFRREQDFIVPTEAKRHQAYQDETEQLARYLRGQRHLPHGAAPTERTA